ncbi:MHS family MFS transporter [Mycolicibacterium goodii]|uniref:MHS family MFS transporter n=2 Tax=Mycolicibacterium goodii TaxID=134601 RepID=A0ABS6HYF4_MYCGD|nr:MHS family MFS transporter [Mycolicibacterium goodii]MBU8841480.1 MHS family MFS transporter [Mycolicibacterium goodii]
MVPRADQESVEHSSQERKVAIGCGIGATVETYDFIGYGTAAALYLGAAFFPSHDPLSATLLSFATLGVGYLARPLGGLLAGHFGDRIGRKPILVASLLMMGIATVGIGCLPTYDQIGIWAPLLLVALRVAQGVAFGAEWGGALLMTFEHAPRHRRGLYTGITGVGFPLGIVLANLSFLFSAHLPGSWPWRLPFLLSSVLIVIGILIRMKIGESPEFAEVKASGQRVKNPLRDVVRDDWRILVRAFFMRIAETAGYAVAVTYMLSYIKLGDPPLVSKSVSLFALTAAAALGIGATLFWARTSDSVGRRPVYLLGAAITAAWGVPMFLLINTGVTALVVVVFVVSYAVCQNSLAGVMGAWFSELLPAKTRAAGISLIYQSSGVIGGFSPLIATALYSNVGWIGPALMFSTFGLLGLVAAIVTKDTWGRTQRSGTGDLRERVGKEDNVVV